MIDWRQGVVSSSYGFFAGGFDISMTTTMIHSLVAFVCDIAGLMAKTEFQPWYSPAGYTRGAIKNVVKFNSIHHRVREIYST